MTVYQCRFVLLLLLSSARLFYFLKLGFVRFFHLFSTARMFALARVDPSIYYSGRLFDSRPNFVTSGRV